MRDDIEFVRDVDCKCMLLQSDNPLAYLDHSDSTPVTRLLIPDSTMAVLEQFFVNQKVEKARGKKNG